MKVKVLTYRSGVMEKPGCRRFISVRVKFSRNVFLIIVFGCAIFLAGLCMMSRPLNASGFALYTSGATELAQCGSVVAHTEGPASNYYNPALLPELEGTQIETGVIPLKASARFTSDLTGRKFRMKRNVFYPYTLFFSHQINEKISAGLGVNSTFGLGTEWPDDWEGRYIATQSDLKTCNINPNLSWKMSDNFFLAAGFDILFGDAEYEQKVEPLLLGSVPPDIHSRVKGKGEGYGYNLGIFCKMAEDLAFGISYRSGIKLKLKGDIEWFQPGIDGWVDTGAKVALDLPAQLFAGVSYRPFKNLIFEIGGKWEGWSSYKNLKIRANQAVFWGNNIVIMPKNWKDVYGFNAGIKYNLDPTLSVTAGYLHEGNPVPSDTFEPSVPVSDRHDFSFGIQKTFGRFKIAVTYLYDKYIHRNKNNRVAGYSASGITANGTYEQSIHMAGLSVSYAH